MKLKSKHSKNNKKRFKKNVINRYELVEKIMDYSNKNKYEEINELENLLLNSILSDKKNNMYSLEIELNSYLLNKHFK